MMSLLVIADDLTGAADTGVQFSKQGVRTLVMIGSQVDPAAIDPAVAMLVVDIESRHLPPDEAARRVVQVVERARRAGVQHFYKKTDSTLRGNIGTELEALMQATDADRLMFVPAFPKAGRFTRNGCQYLGDTLLHATDLGRDPLEPMTDSSVPAIIARQSTVRTTAVSTDADDMARALQSGAGGIFVFDCTSDDDLRSIGRCLETHDALHVTAGPAGLAELLPDLLHLPRQSMPSVSDARPVLVVNGSLCAAALGQVAFAIEHDVADIAVPPAVLLDESSADVDDAVLIVQEAVDLARRGRDVILRTVAHRDELTDYLASSECAPGEERRLFRLAARNMGRLVGRILELSDFGSCFVVGGDTALGVLQAIGCTTLMLNCELLPGVASARIQTAGRTINLITRAGAFGPPDAILTVINRLRTS